MKRGGPLKRKTPLKRTGFKPARKSELKRTSMKQARSKQTKIRASAEGQDCQVRIIGVCCNDPETTVLAHINGSGMGMKASDILGAYSCFECHQWLDGGWSRTHTRYERDAEHAMAVLRTIPLLIEQGLISYV